jgi:hypothetical protein
MAINCVGDRSIKDPGTAVASRFVDINSVHSRCGEAPGLCRSRSERLPNLLR